MPHIEVQDAMFLDMADRLSQASRCISHTVGALIVRDGRIISTGYNGTLAGEWNCDEVWVDSSSMRGHSEWSAKNEIHAEMNAILMAAKHGIAIDGATLYSTLQPCDTCLISMLGAGIKRIVYRDLYVRVEYSEDTYARIKNAGAEIVWLK